MKKINPETQPGLAALKKESPETGDKIIDMLKELKWTIGYLTSY